MSGDSQQDPVLWMVRDSETKKTEAGALKEMATF